jgi:hypothetical protein
MNYRRWTSVCVCVCVCLFVSRILITNHKLLSFSKYKNFKIRSTPEALCRHTGCGPVNSSFLGIRKTDALNSCPLAYFLCEQNLQLALQEISWHTQCRVLNKKEQTHAAFSTVSCRFRWQVQLQAAGKGISKVQLCRRRQGVACLLMYMCRCALRLRTRPCVFTNWKSTHRSERRYVHVGGNYGDT